MQTIEQMMAAIEAAVQQHIGTEDATKTTGTAHGYEVSVRAVRGRMRIEVRSLLEEAFTTKVVDGTDFDQQDQQARPAAGGEE